MPNAVELKAQRQTVWSRAKEINDRADGTAMSAEDKAKRAARLEQIRQLERQRQGKKIYCESY